VIEKYKKIRCFGSSYTEGGGYYFENIDKLSQIHKNYLNSLDEYPKEMKHYSYAGQLQKILNENNHNVSVENYGKCGYGNDRTCRLIYEILENNNCENDLFLIEWASFEREELYSNSINDYVVHIYNVNDDFSYDKGTLMKFMYDNIDLKNSEKLINDYNKEFFNFRNTIDKDDMIQSFLFSYLTQKNIDFILLSGIKDETKEIISDKNYINFDNNHDSFLGYIIKNKLLISDISDVHDNHVSLEGNKLIANKIYNFIL